MKASYNFLAYLIYLPVILAVTCYVVLFKHYEERKIKELSASTLLKNAFVGFFMGLILQSVFILVIYLAGGYTVTQVNPVSFLLTAFAYALTAGFVAEILLRGILFRLTEEKTGTIPALIIFTLLFAILHANSNGATAVSVCATAIQAGLLLSATYVYSRSLWWPIFLHFSWDFAEPGIYGGINPGISTGKTLLNSKISGSYLLTGGEAGPGNGLSEESVWVVSRPRWSKRRSSGALPGLSPSRRRRGPGTAIPTLDSFAHNWLPPSSPR